MELRLDHCSAALLKVKLTENTAVFINLGQKAGFYNYAIDNSAFCSFFHIGNVEMSLPPVKLNVNSDYVCMTWVILNGKNPSE